MVPWKFQNIMSQAHSHKLKKNEICLVSAMSLSLLGKWNLKTQQQGKWKCTIQFKDQLHDKDSSDGKPSEDPIAKSFNT